MLEQARKRASGKVFRATLDEEEEPPKDVAEPPKPEETKAKAPVKQSGKEIVKVVRSLFDAAHLRSHAPRIYTLTKKQLN